MGCIQSAVRSRSNGNESSVVLWRSSVDSPVQRGSRSGTSMEVNGEGEKLSSAAERSTLSGTAVEVNGGGEKLSPAVERSTLSGTAMEVSGGGEKLSSAAERSTFSGTVMEVNGEGEKLSSAAGRSMLSGTGVEVNGEGEKLNSAVERSTLSGTAMEVNGGGEKLRPAVERSMLSGTAVEVNGGGKKLRPEVERSTSGTAVEVNGGGEKLGPAVERCTLSGSALAKTLDLFKKATDADMEQKYEEALQLYNHAIDFFSHTLKYEVHGERSKDSIRSTFAQYLERAEQLKRFLAKKVYSRSSTTAKERKFRDGKDFDSIEELKNQLEGAMVAEKPNIHWDDIVGLDLVKQSLKEAVVLPVKFPHLFTGKRKPPRGILLYGPRGTGKTSLVKAVATEANCTFFTISCLDLVNMQLGAERLMKNMFELARANKPAIIFVDEVDFLCSSMNYNITPHIKTEFLMQMQGVDNDGIHVLGSTNIPWELDAAVRRSFKKRIYIPLLEENTRRQMFQMHIGNAPTNLSTHDFGTLAKKTDGYSGANIGIVVREALMMPLRKIQMACYFKKVSGPSPIDPSVTVEDLLTPCGPRDPGAMEMTWMEVPGDKLLEPKVALSDFIKSLQIIQPTVNAADLKHFEEFTCNFGIAG